MDLGGSLLMATVAQMAWNEIRSPINKLKKDLKKTFEVLGVGTKDRKGVIVLPIVKDVKPRPYGYDIVILLPNGIPPEVFHKIRPCIMSCVDGDFEVIPTGNRHVTLRCYTQYIPMKIKFKEEMLMQTEGLKVPFLVGRTSAGLTYLDLHEKNLLIGGMPGSGKSNLLNLSLTTLKLLRPKTYIGFIDMKSSGVEAQKFEGKFDTAVSLEGAMMLISKAKSEVERRGELFTQPNIKALNITEYNEKATEKLEYHVLVIDEFSLISPNLEKGGQTNPVKVIKEKLYQDIVFIASQGRAFGVVLVISTQRPSKEVVDGLIKAQIHYTVAFRVRNDVNSRILLDNDRASELENVPGRCIVQADTDMKCQVPYMDSKTVRAMLRDCNDESEQDSIQVNTSLQAINELLQGEFFDLGWGSGAEWNDA